MKTTETRTERKRRKKPFYLATVGREKVPVYRRKTPSGTPNFMVANYADGKRRFDSYPDEQSARDAADKLARQLSERDVLGASMTKDDSLAFASATQALAGTNIGLVEAATVIAQIVKEVGSLPAVHEAIRFYRQHHKRTIKKRVADVVEEILKVKEARGAAQRYMEDLRSRLNRFADAFAVDCDTITTGQIQDWLDGLNLAPQTYVNFRRVLYSFFRHAEARSYVPVNPVVGTERVKVKRGDVQIFTPAEITRLLAAAEPDFVASLAIGAFAGLRSAEIVRLEWSDIDLQARHIVVGASRSKTATRRIVPISDNLFAWLSAHETVRKGRLVWPKNPHQFYKAELETAERTAVEADPGKGVEAKPAIVWKNNALRHSFASYRLAVTGDPGRVSGELGNSASMVHKHYKELVSADAAKAWFAVSPEQPANLVQMPHAQTAARV
jgi:integrase